MKIATALDRPPSNYFKKWVKYHSKLFNKEDFIFINFSESNNELKEYLENNGFSNITSLTVVENKIYGRTNLFDEHINRYLTCGVTSNTPFILHCPLKNLINPNYGIYRQFVQESTVLINQLKAVVLNNQHKFIFLDLDELLVFKDINKLLKSNFTQIIPAGYTVIQSINEDIFDWDIPLYQQRSFWKREAYFYDKPIIVQTDINWGPGRHVHHHDEMPVCPDVVLLHLRDICFNYLYNENQCSLAIYPEQPEDHRFDWRDRFEYDKWVEGRQKELTPIIKEIKVLLKKHDI
jgi:hypothetical protein